MCSQGRHWWIPDLPAKDASGQSCATSGPSIAASCLMVTRDEIDHEYTEKGAGRVKSIQHGLKVLAETVENAARLERFTGSV